MDLILYHTSGCHLCELAEDIVTQATADGADIKLTLVDIADSDELMSRYSWTIPVLALGASELNWPFDLAQLRVWLTSPLSESTANTNG